MYKLAFLIVVVFLIVSIACFFAAHTFWNVAKEIKDNRSPVVADHSSPTSAMKAEGGDGIKSWLQRYKYYLEIIQSLLSLSLPLTFPSYTLFVVGTFTAIWNAIASLFWRTDNDGMTPIDWLLISISCMDMSIFLFSLLIFYSGLIMLNPYGMDSLFICLGIFLLIVAVITYKVCRRPG